MFMRMSGSVVCVLGTKQLPPSRQYHPVKVVDRNGKGAKAPWYNQHPKLGGEQLVMLGTQSGICVGLRCQRILNSIAIQTMSTRAKGNHSANIKSHSDKTVSNANSRPKSNRTQRLWSVSYLDIIATGVGHTQDIFEAISQLTPNGAPVLDRQQLGALRGCAGSGLQQGMSLSPLPRKMLWWSA